MNDRTRETLTLIIMAIAIAAVFAFGAVLFETAATLPLDNNLI